MEYEGIISYFAPEEGIYPYPPDHPRRRGTRLLAAIRFSCGWGKCWLFYLSKPTHHPRRRGFRLLAAISTRDMPSRSLHRSSSPLKIVASLWILCGLLRKSDMHYPSCGVINSFFLLIRPETASVFAALGPQACTERPLPQASLGAEEAKIHKGAVGLGIDK